MAAPSSSSLPCVPATVFRVRRKRSADPHEALIVSMKRAKQSLSTTLTPLIFELATTSEVPEITSLDKLPPCTPLNVIDFHPPSSSVCDVPVDEENLPMDERSSDDNPLNALLGAVGEIGDSGVKKETAKDVSEQITLNGVPLVVVDTPIVHDDYVFDFYWNSRGFEYEADVMEVRTAKAGEVELYMGGDETDSSVHDDDDDSNDENNWRNDYPDEEAHSSTEDSDAEEYDGDFAGSVQRRFEEFTFDGSDAGSEDGL